MVSGNADNLDFLCSDVADADDTAIKAKKYQKQFNKQKGMRTMNYTCIFFGCLFIAMGVIFAFGKGHIHLKAWKNMPQKEKDKIDILPLCRNIGDVIMLNGILFLTKGMWSGFHDHWFVCAMVAWFIVAGLDVWYISKGHRYDHP